MFEVLEVLELDAAIEYFWSALERELAPSPKLIELMDQFGGQDAFEVYSAQIFGRQGKIEWPTISRIEVAYDPADQVGLIVWESGIPKGDPADIYPQAIAGWPNCTSPDHALQLQREKLQQDGIPPFWGVTKCFENGVWQYRVLGFESDDAAH